MSIIDNLAAAVGFERKYGVHDLFREFGLPVNNLGGDVRIGGINDAISVVAAMCCARVLGEGVAQIPWRVMRRTDAGRRQAHDHPLFDLIGSAGPNDHQTSFDFRETIVLHAAFTGDAICLVDRVGIDRRIREIVPIPPSMRSFRVEQGRPVYRVRDESGQMVVMAPENIWHIRGPSIDGFSGLGAVQLASNALGLSRTLEKAQSQFFDNGAMTSGVLSVEGRLSKENYTALKEYVRASFARENRFVPMVIDQGGKWMQRQMSGVDSQHLDTRRFQIEEMARAFRVQPIMIMQSDKAATYASAEQMFRVHVVHTLAPWYSRITDSANKYLLSAADRAAGVYTKFFPTALLQGSPETRAKYYQAALGSGGGKPWMTQNEIRDLEDMDRSTDPGADSLEIRSSENAAAAGASNTGGNSNAP